MQPNPCNLQICLILKNNLVSITSCNDSSFKDATYVFNCFTFLFYVELVCSLKH